MTRRSAQRPFTIVLLCAGALLALGCGGARGGRPPDVEARIARGELIRYRALTRDDFRATSRPASQGGHDEQSGAETCLAITNGPEPRVEIVKTVQPDGRAAFTATIRQLAFVALMDRECSWFDPSITAADAAYVLAHEQIHFAIEELSARRLNASVGSLIGVPFAGSSAEEANQLAHDRVDAILETERRWAEEQGRQLDRETSYGFHPERQKRWIERMTAALAGGQH